MSPETPDRASQPDARRKRAATCRLSVSTATGRLARATIALIMLNSPFLTAPASGQYNEEIGAEITPIHAERVPHVREAVLVRANEPRTAVVYPDREPASRTLAESIHDAFQERFNVSIPILASSEVSEEDYRDQTVIHLGNIFNNPELLWFYLHSFTYADASWPGGEGWAIQQAHDPKGYGSNVLIIAASSAAGLEQGVSRFAEEIANLEEPVWSEFILVESQTPPVAGEPEPMSAADIDELEREYLEAMRNNALRETAEQAIWDAKFYIMSGNENYLASFRACVPAHLEFLREGGNQQAETIYFWFFKYAQIWDAVETSDYWDPEFRDTMVNLLYWLSEVVVSIGHFDRSINPYPKNNHETYAAVSLLFPSLYFQKYYDLERAGHWRKLADAVLQTQAEYPRGMDEARFYYEHAGMHALFYSIATGDDTFIESGNARKFADLLIMLTDNTGANPNFGDGGRYGRNRTYYYLLPYANLTGDPRYLGLSNLVKEYVENPDSIWEQGPRGHYHSLHHYIPPIEPDLPPEPPRVSAFPLERTLYQREREDPVFDHIPPPDTWTPYEETFDKLLFRNGYERENEYLLLDGYGRGIHSHRDANVITRFTDNDRIWLVDDTYFRNSAAYHNALNVIRDGEGGFSPPFASLETAGGLSQTGFSRTTATGFNGIDWTRNVFWVKDDMFVVIDEALAQEPGHYTLQTFWRSLGERIEEPHRVQLDQNGESFAISFPPTVGMRFAPDNNQLQDEATWRNYPHADPVLKRTMAYLTPQMEAGDRHALPAVLYTFPSDTPRRVDCRSLNDTVLLTREMDDTRLYFTSPEDLPGAIDTDARMGILGSRLVSLIDVTHLVVNGKTILDMTHPVICEIDFEQGTVTLLRQEDALETDLAASLQDHTENRRKRDLPGPPEMASGIKETLERLWSAAPAADRPETGATPTSLKPESLREFDELTIHRAAITDLDEQSPGPDFVLATDAGVQGWSSRGGDAPLWSYETRAPVKALALAEFGEETGIVFGTFRGKVVALNGDGSERWVYEIERRPDSLYGRGARIHSISAGDVDNSGYDEILVTTSHWMSHFLSAEGQLIWGDPVARNNLISSAFGDLNGDGNRELLIGSENFRMHAFTPDYKILWSFRTGRGTVEVIETADIDGDGADEVLIGSSDGHIYAIKTRADDLAPSEYHPRDPALTPTDTLFEYDTGGDVIAIATGDLDRNNRKNVIAGSDSFFLYRFNHDGRVEAMANTRGMVRHVSILDDVPSAYRVAAGMADGRVLLLTPSLDPSTIADISSEVLDVQYDRETNSLYAVGRRSFGVFPLE